MPALSVPQAMAFALQHHHAGRWAEAEAIYRSILEAEPGHVEAQSNLGSVLAAQGRHDEAVAAFRRALEMKPDFAVAHFNLGNASKNRGCLDEAVAAYRRALELDPSLLPAYGNLGAALFEQRQFAEAISTLRRALDLDPRYAAAHNNLGTALAAQGLPEEAMASYRRALELQPNLAEAHKSLGDVLLEIGDLDGAAAAFRRAVEIQPTYAKAKFSQAVLSLLLEDFDRGWPLYESRHEAFSANRRDFAEPMWRGEALRAKRVLIHAEQGFGDAIQFVRYVEMVADLGAETIIECPRELVRLFRTVKGATQVVCRGDALPHFDLHVPMLSLPLVFKTTPDRIPAKVPYLFADADLRTSWKQRSSGNSLGLKVGLAWSSNPQNPQARRRDVALDRLLPLLHVENATFFSLQIRHGTDSLERLPANVARPIDLTQHVSDFADLAAFLSELDLVISVDTAVAHLAGALGRPCWTMLPFIPDWRWGLQEESTSWYPTMRLFRQPKAGDGDAVVQSMTRALMNLTGGALR